MLANTIGNEPGPLHLLARRTPGSTGVTRLPAAFVALAASAVAISTVLVALAALAIGRIGFYIFRTIASVIT